MRLPAKDFSVKVGPFRYDVQRSENVTNEGDAFGSVHHQNQRIFLAPYMAPDKQAETFLHEVLHCIHTQTGLRHDLNSDKPPCDEQVVARTSVVLYQVIQENPHIFGDTGGA